MVAHNDPKSKEMIRAGTRDFPQVRDSDLVSRGLRDLDDVLLLDVTPLTLSISVNDGRVTPIIDRNSVIPLDKTFSCTTDTDFQTTIQVDVLQGEGPRVSDNLLLGRCIIGGLAPKPKGVCQILLTLQIDANGMLNLSVKDSETGRELQPTIIKGVGLSKNEVEVVLREARSKGWIR